MRGYAQILWVIHRIQHRLASGLDPVLDLKYIVVNALAVLHFLGDLAVCVKHRGVVFSANNLADFRQRKVGHGAAKVHGDLSSLRNGGSAALAVNFVNRDVVVLGNLGDDLGCGHNGVLPDW